MNKKGLSIGDWLMFLYIFKWAHVWVAPTWLFVTVWILFVINILIAIDNET